MGGGLLKKRVVVLDAADLHGEETFGFIQIV